MRLKKVHFLNSLLEKNEIPCFYKSLRYSFNDKIIYQSTNCFKKEKELFIGPSKKIIAFPKFFTPEFENADLYLTKSIIQKNRDGFGIIIKKNLNDINLYLRNNLGKKSGKTILNRIIRLENCFNITYKVFYGDIDRDNYDYLMSYTRAMLKKRFEERGVPNFILKNWNKYLDMFFPLIIKKQVSIFVTYNNKEPIQISINFHYNKILFGFILAYNIDFSKFGIGVLGIYKRLEWCIENNYEFMDLGNGELDHKKKWCNYQYEMETHIFYKENSKTQLFSAFLEVNIIRLKNILKGINIQEQILKINPLFKNNNSYHPNKYQFIEIGFLPTIKVLTRISLDNKTYPHLKKSLYDFQYVFQEHSDNIEIYEYNKNTLVFKGKNTIHKVIFNE